VVEEMRRKRDEKRRELGRRVGMDEPGYARSRPFDRLSSVNGRDKGPLRCRMALQRMRRQ